MPNAKVECIDRKFNKFTAAAIVIVITMSIVRNQYLSILIVTKSYDYDYDYDYHCIVTISDHSHGYICHCYYNYHCDWRSDSSSFHFNFYFHSIVLSSILVNAVLTVIWFVPHTLILSVCFFFHSSKLYSSILLRSFLINAPWPLRILDRFRFLSSISDQTVKPLQSVHQYVHTQLFVRVCVPTLLYSIFVVHILCIS